MVFCTLLSSGQGKSSGGAAVLMGRAAVEQAALGGASWCVGPPSAGSFRPARPTQNLPRNT